MTENLNGMTIRRLKEIISNIDDNVEIGIWDHLGLVTSIEIEVMTFLNEETSVDINIDGIYPYQKGNKKMKTMILGTDHHISATYNIIKNVVRGMRMCGCNRLESTTTGEVIEREELERVLGILSGLKNIDEMY